MYRKHCFCFCFIVSIFSITNGDNFNKSPLNTPAQMLSYFDEHFASLTLDLTRRIEELESKQTEDAHRIDILEQLHVRDVGQMMAIRHAVDVLRTENGHLQDQVDSLQKQLHTQISITKTNAATTVLENDISDVVSHTSQVLLGNISSGWTEASNATETISKPRLRRNLNGNKNWEKNLNMKSRAGLTTNEYAFHAVLGHNLNDPGNEHAIAFEKIITTVGGHYSKNTGAFSCLQAGVYVFHWSVRSITSSGYMYTELVRNGDVIGTANSYHASTGSAAAVVQLSVGDEVWVRVGTHSTGADIELVDGQLKDPDHNIYKGIVPSRAVLSDIVRRMDKLENQHDSDSRMIAALVKRVTDLETRHAKDAQTLAEMTSNINVLTIENRSLREKVDVLLNNVLPSTLGSESTDSSLTTENTREKQRAIIDERLDSTIPNTGLGLRESQTDASNEAVAFYAILDHENHDISQGSTIVFENIVSNEGGHYSQFTGMFTIPSAGIYVFHWNVKSDYNSWVISELVRNGSALGTDLSTYPNSGSATAIAVLERGDRIWVRITSHTAGAEVQPTFTTFSGFLLQP